MDLQFDSKVCFVNKNLILVRHSIAASTLALPDLDEMKGLPAVGMKKTLKPGEIAPERRCGEEINSFWYALDVLVPLLNLKQEERCSITMRDAGYWWRFWEAFYAILGAIITPIMLLSVTGMLRRYIER